MTLSAVVLDVEPDPVRVAARLADRPGFVFLHAGADGLAGRRSFVGVDPVEASSAWLPEDGGPARASSELGDDTRGRVPRWVGAIPYEPARRLERKAWTRWPDERPAPHLVQPKWWRYAAMVDIDTAAGVVRVVGDDARRVRDLARDLAGHRTERTPGGGVELRPLVRDDSEESEHAHLARIRRAQELIAAGDLYQVNLARRQRFAVLGSPLAVYLALAEEAPAPFGGCLDLGDTVVCASSPELFLSLDREGRLSTAPIKGTRPRGADAEADRRLAGELGESIKEQAELTMILDVERNDLGKIAGPGSVRLLRAPEVETHRTLHHRSAVLGALLRADKTPHDAVVAMFPSGSVTGAPKVRAMEVIAQLEFARRGLYTGAFGYVAFDGSIRLAMAIRVLTIQNGEGHYFAGGGIVADSDPEAELAETRWKATQLERLSRGNSGKLA